MAGEKPPKPHYRNPPKKWDGTRYIVDVEKVKQRFLASDSFAWADFCTEQEYNPTTRQLFPVRAWIQEKLQQQVQIRDEGKIGKALDVKSIIQDERLNFPEMWNEESKNSLQIMQYMEMLIRSDIKHDVEQAEALKKGLIKKEDVKPRFKTKPSEMAGIVNVKKSLQAIHMNALLIPPGDAYQSVVPLRELDNEIADADAESERLRSIGVEVIGNQAAMNQNEIAKMMAKWIDQAAKPEQAAIEVESSPHAPLTPLLESDDDDSE